jgi:hypothetical protein
LYELLAEAEPPKIQKLRHQAADGPRLSRRRRTPALSSLRATLRQLIHDRPGITRNALIDLLKSAGFPSGADSTFDNRLDTELGRMLRGGHVTQTFEGGYLPKAAA